MSLDPAGTYTGTPELTAGKLRELLHYEPSTGVFTWLMRTAWCVHVGDVAGGRHRKGYIQISVLGRLFLAHRLAWLYAYGQWPADQIDHLNGVRDDNRIANLRDVSNAINSQNKRQAFRTSSHGFLGATMSGNRWMAKIRIDGKDHYLGTHDTPELAHVAYLDAKRLMHPGCNI